MAWCSRVPPKVQFFLWCLLPQVDETADHLMLHCSFSKGVWQKILQPVGIDINQAICPHSVVSCLHSWLSPNTTAYRKCIWLLVPYATWWSIWKTRNDAIFNNKPASIETTIRNIKANLWHCTSMLSERRGYGFGNLMLE
ncbi:hypothetical protein IFM89_008030 [Coptis chinensis]|uniref:Reverse transcriptase zinc-binding domain-containing protein n=1 Tax=Coptis chinensis TaxID=261450 RepID=A0A835LYY8_9MAGN|nr:hypothetical protein IFM89_008030 [Coptis chinensis]